MYLHCLVKLVTLHYIIVRCVLTLCYSICYIILYHSHVTPYIVRCALTSHCVMLPYVTLYYRGSQLAVHLIVFLRGGKLVRDTS